jgi:hypothetical protein
MTLARSTAPALALALALAAQARAADPQRAAGGADAAGPAATASPSPSAAPRESVALRFAWPADLSADVEYSRSRTQTGRPASELKLRGRLVAAARGQGIAVRYSGWSGAEGEAAAMLRASERLAVVVDASGQAQAVEGIPDAVEALRKIPPFTDRSPQIAKVLELLPASLEKDARENWGMLVGTWAGNDLAVGETYESESKVAVPAVPEAKIRIRLSARAVRVAECPGRNGRRCVELWMRSEPDANDVRRVVTALMERFEAPREAIQGALSQLDVVMEATILSEPSTLVPSRLEVKKSTRLAGPDGKPASREDVQRWTFGYPAAR